MEAGEGCQEHNLPSLLASTPGRIAQGGGNDIEASKLGVGRGRNTDEGGKDGGPARHLPLRTAQERH